jgi:uncharacterized damage-inducible protein DinB
MTDDFQRPDTPLRSPEAETLLGFLDFQRSTLEWKTRGLTDEQLRAPLHPTAMTLGGLLKHLARVEDSWFAETVGESPGLEPWASMPWAEEWTTCAGDTGEQLRQLWADRVERSRDVVTAALSLEGGLDRAVPAWDGAAQVSLRWVLVHMIEEYARHNGHADLLREAVDGETGE